MKLLFGNSWLRETIPADLEDEPMAGGTPESRFFVDHGAIHDRKTGQHVGMEAEIGCQERLFKLLCEMDSEIQRLQRLLSGETREKMACEWSLQNEWEDPNDDNWWNTGCGHEYCLGAGNLPTDFGFCMYCGNKPEIAAKEAENED